MTSTELLERVVEYANTTKRRVTYGAAAEYAGVSPRAISQMLGEHSVRNSWIVSASSGLPTDYASEHIDEDLDRISLVIKSGDVLRRVLG